MALERAAAGDDDDVEDEGEEPDHELYRLDRLSRIDAEVDDWFGCLLGEEGDDAAVGSSDGERRRRRRKNLLGGVSESAAERLLSHVKVGSQEVRISERGERRYYIYNIRPPPP